MTNLTNLLQVLSHAVTLGAVIFFIYVIYKLYDETQATRREIKKLRVDLKASGQINNDCDVCCRECEDKFACSGACVHAVKPEQAYKPPIPTEDANNE